MQAGIVGAAGFAGVELVRRLLEHPDFDLTVITSGAEAGTPISSMYPEFIGHTDLEFTPHDNPALLSCDAVFLAVPHTAAMAMVPGLLEAGVCVFDLSADYRLKDADIYEAWYGVKHTSPQLLEQTAFGLPELFEEDIHNAAIARVHGQATLVACAGCYPTATSLAAAPAVFADKTQGTINVQAISGVTGAGKKATDRTHFCFANENVEAYGVGTHRHTPEIEQILGKPGQVLFIPHLAPLNRGLLSTVTMQLSSSASNDTIDSLQALYEQFYEESPFVTVLPQGVMPKTSSVAGTNNAHIGLALHKDTQTLIAVCAIDNLCKGAAGQAVQCANIVFGLPQTAGLSSMSVPV